MMRPDQIEAIARALVAMLFPALEAAMLNGLMYRAIIARTVADSVPMWRLAYGPDVAAAAVEALTSLPPDAVLTTKGRQRWLGLSPVGPLPPAHPVEAMPTPREAIGGRWRQAWSVFWRPPSPSG